MKVKARVKLAPHKSMKRIERLKMVADKRFTILVRGGIMRKAANAGNTCMVWVLRMQRNKGSSDMGRCMVYY